MAKARKRLRRQNKHFAEDGPLYQNSSLPKFSPRIKLQMPISPKKVQLVVENADNLPNQDVDTKRLTLSERLRDALR